LSNREVHWGLALSKSISSEVEQNNRVRRC
jgi:hypothetical protein